LVSTTELYQLLKLPVLLEHYTEHKKQNSDLSFLDFLSLHYNQAFDHDNTDHKLPFKSHDSNISMNIVAFIAQPFSVILAKPIVFIDKTEIGFRQPNFTSSVISTIWQPPRAC
jgi:hypothetical protein